MKQLFMEEKEFSPSNDLILREFEIVPPGDEAPSEEELFQHLCDRIAWLIEHNMEYLLSLLYRNDVDEGKIHFALSPLAPEPANVGLARLVLERQKQRVATKRQFGKQDLDDVEDSLKW
ncbi:MAG: hypothetical protein AAB316_20845 [Bacteroidota bacterium]